MSEEKIIVGLDIGTTKIACIVGRKGANGKIEILGYGKAASTGVSRGIVTNIDETVNAIKAAVDEASAQSNVDIKSVNVGIAGQHIKSLQHRGVLMRDDRNKEISDEELEKLRLDTWKINMIPGEEIIDVIPQEYFVDGEIGTTPKGMLGSKLEANFHVIIGQNAAAMNILKCIERAGLEMDHMILEPIASAEAVLDEEEKEAGVALVDIGGGTTDIAIFHENKIYHSAVIPFGGNIITEDISKGCAIIRRYAEDVKVKFGSAVASENRDDELVSIPGIRGRAPKEISFKNLANIIQARMEEIFELVNYEIQKVNSQHKLIAGIVLTGGGALMKHIQQLASFKTGLDVRIGYPNEHLSEDSIKELASPMYATGIGLVIEGIARAEYQEKMERAKHKEPIVVIPHKPVEEEEIVEEQPEEPTRRSRRQKKEGEKKHRFDLTKIITVFLSEENEIKE
ncbi:MAG: cell division protein FtsA [Bacteroidales bacterium]|nr:cell division protein FtsA [Bacteroidales bacterium]MBR6847452.1 cell division protein FtsA [Bacteroidales bacterium]